MPQQPKIAVVLLALALAACASPPATPPSGTPIALSPATQGELAAYLGKVKVTRPGAFAVSPDGRFLLSVPKVVAGSRPVVVATSAIGQQVP